MSIAQKLKEWAVLNVIHHNFNAQRAYLQKELNENIPESIPFGSTINVVNKQSTPIEKLGQAAILATGLLGGSFGLYQLLNNVPLKPNVVTTTPKEKQEIEGVIDWEFSPEKDEKPKINLNFGKENE